MRVPIAPLLLDRHVVAELITLRDCIPVVEAAFAAHARGAALSTGLLHIDTARGEFHIKVGGFQGARSATGSHIYFAVKVNGGFFQNREAFGLPNIVGLIVLCDGSNGVPLAVMESGLITRLRTGASTAVAAKYLARSDSRTITVCGAGVQAEIQLRALMEVLQLKQAFIWSRSGAADFAHAMRSALGIDVEAVTELGTSCPRSDVIVTCTPAKHWFLGRAHVRAGTFIAAVGADSAGKQELEPELLSSTSVVPDLLGQAAQVGDLHHAIARALMRPDQIRGELGAVIAGTAQRRCSDEETIVFDSTGTALQDAAVAAAVYEKALQRGCASSFAFWS